MINSRDLKSLHTKVAAMAEAFLSECKKAGYDVIITSTYRDNESQNNLYAQGRTSPGHIVTNAKGGQSFHNYRVAFDIVPVIGGKPLWSTIGDDRIIWQKIGAIGVKCGLEWAGNWHSFVEFPHFQFTGGLTLADFQAGRSLP